MYPELVERLVCPQCDASPQAGLDVAAARCRNCGSEFFDLHGLPCWFANGLQQRALWQDAFAKYIEQSDVSVKLHQQEIALPDITSATRQRLQNMADVRKHMQTSVIDILRKAGLQPQKHPQFQAQTAEGLAQYYELMLRDWGWHAIGDSDYRCYDDENRLSLENILTVVKAHQTDLSGDLLVLGSGAGRLSWDLHCHLKSRTTVAVDRNPLLIQLSKSMVRDRQTLNLCDTRKFPRHNLPEPFYWQLQCPAESPERHDSWFALAGDAWSLPFDRQSFDLIVTPWFLDITGRDCRDLIAVIEGLLRPGGYWLNYGPLLYSDLLPESQKYTFAELRHLLGLARFDLLGEDFFITPYTHSPLSERGRIEEIWCFLAQSAPDREHLGNAGEWHGPILRGNPPPWLVLPHLPVPKLTLPPNQPDWLGNILQLIDGQRSIHELVEIIAPNLPEGHDPYGFIYGLFDQYLMQ